MLRMDKQNYLSNLSQFEGLSLREISKRSGHHFNTVKKYVDKEGWNKGYKPRKERPSLLEPLMSVAGVYVDFEIRKMGFAVVFHRVKYIILHSKSQDKS